MVVVRSGWSRRAEVPGWGLCGTAMLNVCCDHQGSWSIFVRFRERCVARPSAFGCLGYISFHYCCCRQVLLSLVLLLIVYSPCIFFWFLAPQGDDFGGGKGGDNESGVPGTQGSSGQVRHQREIRDQWSGRRGSRGLSFGSSVEPRLLFYLLLPWTTEAQQIPSSAA